MQHTVASPDSFRIALSLFAASVTVVTTWDEQGKAQGMTVTAFSSVSIDPLLVLVCVNTEARTYGYIRSSQQFAVNILDSSAQEIAEYCARPGANKNLDRRWLATDGQWHSPVLSGALAVLDCDIEQSVTAGTHGVLIGRVVGVGYNRNYHNTAPLVHFRSAYRQLQEGVTHPRPQSLPIVLEEFS